MNRTRLKNYAPQARRDFIQAMTDRAAFYGLTATKIEPVVERGDVAVIAGREHPRTVAKKRRRLEDRVTRHGFEQTMEALAYTWFNRLGAIRFMELHGYLEHGYRVLSHPQGKPTPEIIQHAENVELPGLRKEVVIDLKLAGDKEAELYRLLLTAQCNALNSAMPFLFEKIEDETELLLPGNLLHSDSLVRKIVSEIDEEDWQEVEIIGWLYQFYISEKKGQVIGKVVASEDIPAATQLFTPNWIVKYLVQNTLGRQWLATCPMSPLRQQMAYYIEPAEQTPEVLEQLKTITPAALNPEELTLLDPACGSGHILVEAYDLFKAIYRERGYQAHDIPALIIQKNLFGLEIDDRAAQLAAFALLMKARADDRRIFDRFAKPNILAFEESRGLNVADITYALNSPTDKDDVPNEYLIKEIEEDKAGLFGKKAMVERDHVAQGDVTSLLALFEHAKTFGSLIQVPPQLVAKLSEIEERLDEVLKHGDLTHEPASCLKPLLKQARFLTRQYDAVVANPPYMGNGGMNALLKKFAADFFPASKSDLFAVSTERFLALSTPTGFVGLMTPFTWMFLKSYEALRALLLETTTLRSLIQPEYHAFFDSAYVPVCAFVTQRCHTSGYHATFIKLSDFYGAELQPQKTLEAIKNPDCGWMYHAKPDDFRKIPGKPIAFSVGPRLVAAFESMDSLADHATLFKGLSTGENHVYIRFWFEVPSERIEYSCGSRSEARASQRRWFPCNKGGAYRKWSGNADSVIDWQYDGARLFSTRPKSVVRSPDNYFLPCVSWSKVTSGAFSARLFGRGFIPLDSSSCIVGSNTGAILLLVNSKAFGYAISKVSETLNYEIGQVGGIPFPAGVGSSEVAGRLTRIAERDWDAYETSWNFQSLPILATNSEAICSLEQAYLAWVAENRNAITEMRRLEEENNRLFIEAYGLANELSPDVPIEQVTLTVNPAYRYGGKLTKEQQSTRFRQSTIEELISYAIGCAMGRYSLAAPGLIYAHSGNEGFDPSRYGTFPANDDGIIPLLGADWGVEDDATMCVVRFIAVAWPKEYLDENLKFIADSLGPTGIEQPRDTIRRYLGTGFYKDHLQTYKKRPIYWLFSSGRQRAFQCLVYLHRYHEGTLARMRTEYVIPLQGLLAARIEQLEGDKAKAASTSHRRKLQKEQDDLKKEQSELFTFEEKLKHAADQKISLDLDDGVKVNYRKFGDLLAESNGVAGGTDDE